MHERSLPVWLMILWPILVYGAHRLGGWIVVGVGFYRCGIGVGLGGGLWAGFLAPGLFGLALPVYYWALHWLGLVRGWPTFVGYAGVAPLLAFLVWLALTTRTEGGDLVLARLVRCLT